ncbi:MAG: hypothetical protein K2P92_08755 [Bdellovibrionaceae bacterium]|nr:hypothetical protein [Pseudobdellovibrionaceae bacterium]
MLSDARSGTTYTYNNANRLKTVSAGVTLVGTYTYNGMEQLITRIVANSGAADGTTHFIHDQFGNIIAELNSTGATAASAKAAVLVLRHSFVHMQAMHRRYLSPVLLRSRIATRSVQRQLHRIGDVFVFESVAQLTSDDPEQ